MDPIPPDSCTGRALQKVLWWTLTMSSVLVLVSAMMLEPDARGYGTHQQLGLPPCGFRLLTGLPCPGCGLTTAFAHAVRGDWLLAASANPFGLILFAVACASLPLGVTGALRGWSFDELFERFALGRWALAVAGCGIAVWVARVFDVL
jgi:hypothetical protein